MKYYFFIIVAVVISILGSVFFASNLPVLTNEVEEGKNPVPHNYWEEVRSHPIFGYNHNLYLNAISEVNKLKTIQSKAGDINQQWNLVGPGNIGGRFNVLTQSKEGSDTIYAGAANGGVFRTQDGGNSWNPIFDFHANMAIGAIEVNPQNANTLYIGTGDRNFGGHSYDGNGLYKSVDFGNTWSNFALQDVGIITDISMHPTDTSEIIVASLGSGFAKTNERGIYRTIDNGVTWQNTLFISDSSGVCDLVRDPNNPDILYAASFNRLNMFGNGIVTGPDAQLHKSIDGGLTWTRLTNGLPVSEESRVGVAVSAANSDVVYTIFVGTDYQIQGIYKSNDAGQNFSLVNDGNNLDLDNALGGFGWYFGSIHVNPYNENHLVLPGVNMFESLDGGLTWSLNVPEWFTYEVHADKHDVEFLNATDIMIATDGGLYKKVGNGNWQDIEDIPVTQFYDIETNTYQTGIYAGGAQDNGTSSGSSTTINNWSRDFGGDGFKVHYSPQNDKTYYETQRGNIYVEEFGSAQVISTPNNERLNWFTPYDVNDENDDILIGSNRVLWMLDPPYNTVIPVSGDLTRTALGATTPERFHTIVELERKKFNEEKVLVGTSDGLVWKSDNFEVGVTSWVNITANLPEKFVTSVNYSLVDDQTYFVSFNGYYNNNTTPYIYKTIDGGQSWVSISGNIPATGVNDLLITENTNDQTIFAATDVGVFVTENGGQTWDLLGMDLPTITVSEINIDYANNLLIAGTYGRSMWSYDISTFNVSEASVSLAENNMSTVVNVYPNPTTTKLTILSSTTEEMFIYSVTGKLVATISVEANQDYSLDVSLWSKGNYLLKHKNGNHKFAIQ